MDSLHIGSDELVYLQTDKVRLTIKGKAVHPRFDNVEQREQQSVLKVKSNDEFTVCLKDDTARADEFAVNNVFVGEYSLMPLFYEQQSYEFVIEADADCNVEFWHENYNIRKAITAVGRSRHILSGIINFGNDIGLSDFVVRINGKDYLSITIEVFPSKLSYKEDYQAILNDVTAEVYNIIFDFLRKTYVGYQQNDKIGNSPVEFFSIIDKIFNDLLKAADMVLRQPHHQLENIREILPSHKVRQMDNNSIRWLQRHPQYVAVKGNMLLAERTLAVRKQVTYDTKENRLIKHILQSAIRKLHNFKKYYLRLQREIDKNVINKIDVMIQAINRRCHSGILASVNAIEESYGMSLVFSMATGYRELYKCYLMLSRGLSVTGDVFNISVKDLALLYEYWCFIKLNSLLRNSKNYMLLSQNIVRVQGNGLYVSLVKGKGTKVKYQNIRTKELVTLTYNYKEVDVPTVNQKPDNILTLEKKGTDIQYEYIFDAKYRINPALPGSYYYNAIGHTPGPEVDDINTMHRYRDAIVYRNDSKRFERMMFGAYVLFPYGNEAEYRKHRFYTSIEKVNIGGLPFLPSATTLVQDLLEQLIDDSPISILEKATLPRGIEEKLAKVDWSVRDVLIGVLSSKKQLDVCLKHGFYHIPAARIKDDELPVRYIAIYQSKKMFGAEAGIRYYGEVTKCIPVRRKDIKELPSQKEELYYRFEVKEWKMLDRAIAPKELGFVRYFTNLFLLKHSTEIPELWIKSEEEYRLYYELKRALVDTAINDEEDSLGFSFDGFNLNFNDGKILVSKDGRVKFQYNMEEFSKRPNAIFRLMRRDMRDLF